MGIVECMVLILVTAMTGVLLSGHGSDLIAGYNMASEEEKQKYNKKRLCRVVGGGMAVIEAAALIMIVFDSAMTSFASGVLWVIIIGAIVVMMFLANVWCRK